MAEKEIVGGRGSGVRSRRSDFRPGGAIRSAIVIAAAVFSLGLLAAAPRSVKQPKKTATPGKTAVELVVLHARIVTMNDAFRVLEDGGLAVDGGKIVAVADSADVSGGYGARSTWDAGGSLVLPGLVNTHGHAAMVLLRGLADDLPLDRWLTEHIFPAEAKNVSPEFVYDGTLLAALEMIEGGTTTFADMYYFESDAARAVEKSGLRGVLGETFIDFPVPDHKDLPATIAYMKQFAARWKGHARITPAAAPHSPYTCSRETLLAARDLAHAENLPLLIHVAETRKELDDARKNWQQSPFLRLASVGFFDPAAGGKRVPIVAAHGVWMDDADMALAKQYGVSLSHNPESNMKLASGIADVPGWQRAGLVWGLGTDGAAGSNNDLSMFEAMDFAGKLAKVSKSDPTVLPARDLVAAATRGGAKTLGLDASIGSLEPGKRADFIAVRGRTAHNIPFQDPYSALVYSIKASDVTDVWVEGRRLLAGGKPTTLDASEILGKAMEWRRRVNLSLAPKAARVELGKEAFR